MRRVGVGCVRGACRHVAVCECVRHVDLRETCVWMCVVREAVGEGGKGYRACEEGCEGKDI